MIVTTINLAAMAVKLGRHSLGIRKVPVDPSSMLASLSSGASFFYLVDLDGVQKAFTPDATLAREVFRDYHRWCRTGHLSCNP